MRAALVKISAFLVAYGLFGVLALSLLDSMGIPIPAAVDLLLLDVSVHSTRTPSYAYLTALMAVVGSLAGNVALFQGVRHGRRLLAKTQPAPGEGRRLQEWFRRYGLLTIFVPAVVPFVPLPLKIFVISAAALHTSFGRFVGVVLVARIIRYFGMAYLGLKLGEDAHGFLLRNGWTIAGIALAIALAFYFVIRASEGREAAAAD